jgi:hypothetical protein
MVRLTCVFRLFRTRTMGAAEPLVDGIEQAGVAGLGEALAAAFGVSAVEVDAVDQPGPVTGVGADQRRHGEARSMPAAVTRTSRV